MEPEESGVGSSGRFREEAARRQYRRRLLRPDHAARAAHDQTTPTHGTTRGAVGISPLEHFHPSRTHLPWANVTPQDNEAMRQIERRLTLGSDEDTDGIGSQDEEAQAVEDEEVDEEEEGDQEEEEAPFDASAVGLKEISNLASFTVSSYKPGCGVKELRDDDVNQFWQSDGPQPHRLNIHFIKRVEIRALRLFLDYELDESYTPTKIQITAGTGPNLTIPFTTMELSMPKGWIDVPIGGAGGGPDGNSLCCWFIRVVILENHQNGKDTHIRGIKVYALDDSADTAENNPVDDLVEAIDDYHDQVAKMDIHDHDEDAVLRHDAEVRRRKAASKKFQPGDGGLSVPFFMREPEIR